MYRKVNIMSAPVQATPELLAVLQAAGLVPAEAKRTDPAAGVLLAAIGDGLEAVLTTGKPFTTHSVTEKAREMHPDLNIRHEVVRQICHTLLSGSAKYARQDVTIGGHDAALYTPLA